MIETSNPAKELGDHARPAAEHMVGKIIVVDDEFELKNALVKGLSAQSFEVRGFTNGHDALKVLRKESFDLLISDLMMPEMDGITLIKSALEIDPHLVAIMMTGQGTIQTAVDAMRFGAFDYVLKPFRLKTIMPVLTRAINSRRLRMENLQLRETVAIYSLCQTISFTLDTQTLLSKLADAALQQSDADEVSILLPTEDGKELFVAAVRGEARDRLLGERIPLDQSIASWVARERLPLLLNGEVHDERFVALWPRPDIRSAVSVPMQVANKLVGIINLNMTNRVRPFTLGQMKALTILASTAAAALESASLYTQVKAAEKRYRSIFENATEGLFQSSPSGRLLTANPEFARILGYASPEEAVQNITDVSRQLYADPEDRLEADRRTEKHLLVGFEMKALRKDGETIWVNVNRRAVCSEGGEVLFFEGSVLDITERKRAEHEKARLNAEIETQRLRLKNMVASVPGVVWEAWGEPDAANQRIDFVSDYVESMLGYSVEEWVSTPNFWLTIVHPSDREEVRRIANAAYVSGQSCRLEFRWLAKDGREVWVESGFVAISNEDGQPIGMRGVTTDISERKRAEEALKQSESQLAEAQGQAHIGSWNLDLPTNTLTWSDEHYRIFGVEPGDIDVTNSSEVFELIHPADREKLRQQGARTIETREAFNFKYRVIRRDGEERIIQSSGNVACDEEGKPVRLFGTAQDITERELAEQLQEKLNTEIQEQRERLDTIVGSVPGIVFESWSSNSRLRESRTDFVSDYIETMLGYSVSEWLEKPGFWLEAVHPQDRERVRREAELQFKSGSNGEFEFRWIRKDKRIVWVRAHTIIIRDQQENAMGVRGVITDISAAKQAESALRESEERYRELVENADDLIYEHDLQGNYTACNRAGERITGYTLAESLKLNLVDTVAPECVDKAKEMMARKLIGEKVTAYELIVLTKDGGRVPVEVNTRLVLREGVAVGVQGIARDITERKRAQQMQARRETLAFFRADISAALAESGASLKDTLSSCARTMVEHLDAAFARIWTLNHEEQVLDLQASAGLYTHLDGPHASVPVGSFKIGNIAFERSPHITNDVQNDERVSNKEWARAEGMVAFAGYPLIVDDRVVGVMAMFSKNELAEDPLDALASVSDLISQAIERKRTAEALSESEERYRLLFESNPQPMWVYDLETLAFLAVNKSAVAHYGYSEKEFLSMTIKDIRPPEDIPALFEAVELARVGAGEPGIWRHLKKDGSLIEVEIKSHSLIFDGRRTSLILAQDITERLQAEEALRKSEARNRAILEAAMDCIITIDHQGLVLDWNPAAENTFGYSQSEAMGRSMGDLIIPPHLRERHQHGFARYLATGQARILGRRLELSAQRRDGTQFPIELTITRIQSKGAHVFTGYLRDITERKQAENRLTAQYSVTRALAESNSIAEVASKILQAVCESLEWEYGLLWTVDRAANVLRCSQVWRSSSAGNNEFETASKQFAFAPGIGLPGRVWQDGEPAWITDVAQDDNFPRLAMATNAGLHGGCAFPVRLRSEILGVVEFLSHSIREPDPDLLAMMVTIGSQIGQFIERKRVEDALSNSEEQLRQSQKLEAVGQLAGGVAHDFNNLLTVIGGYSSILLTKLPKDSPHHSNVEEIKKASDRAGALTRQLLAFSRKQILQPKILDLNVAVADLEKMLRRLIGEDIDLLTMMSPGLGKVKADPGQMEQVLLNLIVNARDAMPHGGKLTIETSNVMHSPEYAERHGTVPGPYIMLAVTDNGCGMSADIQSRIFEPFFTTKDAGKGTGLGLATVYGIVKQSGGSIWVYSERDRGTTFKVFLPRVDDMPHADSGPLKPIPHGTETVLVVEDEDQVRAILTHILEGQGYQVVSASNGDEALSISQDREVDISLMITDVVMPQMSGRELAELVSKVRPDLPVLFMSGYTDDAIVHHGLLDQKLNFIQKPFDSAGVARKVREVLDSTERNHG